MAFYVMQIPHNQILTTKTHEYEHLPGFFFNFFGWLSNWGFD